MNTSPFDTIINKKQNKMDIEKLFRQYDFWEEYDYEKKYNKNPYKKKKNNKIKSYINILCSLEMDNGEQKYYVLSERYKSEIEYLFPYCPCIICNSFILSKINILCPCCYGCIKNNNDDFVINDEILKIAKENFKNSKKINWNKINITEISIILIFLIFIFYILIIKNLVV